MIDYIPVIGLEIHAELTTASKLFCRCPNTSSQLDIPPNTAVCPVCLGLPGALPVLNQRAVEATLILGQSLGSHIPEVTKWDRKNYFYPDLPKGYQISQYDQPLCSGGTVNWFDRSGAQHTVALTRIHLEEDTGKLVHPEGKDYSLIDYNRSSIPLLELVTEPVITSAAEAKQFSEEYQRRLRELGIAEASMEKGQMRCEANISVIPAAWATDPEKRLSGTKVEIKNLNSFRSLERAIVYELERQSRVLTTGGRIMQETRGWNEGKGETYVMRTKETADDYRYFPEPDLGTLTLAILKPERLQSSSRSDRFETLIAAHVPPSMAHIVMNDPDRAAFFDSLISQALPEKLYPLAAQWISQEPTIIRFEPEEIIAGLSQLENKTIRPSLFKETLLKVRPGQLASALEQSNQAELDIPGTVSSVLIEHPDEVAAYRAGRKQLFGYFVGQVRAKLGGAGDPVMITEALENQLNQKNEEGYDSRYNSHSGE